MTSQRQCTFVYSSNSATGATHDLSSVMWSSARCCHHTHKFWNDPRIWWWPLGGWKQVKDKLYFIWETHI